MGLPGAVSPIVLWRQSLQRMKQLKTLRLGLHDGRRPWTEDEEKKFGVFHVDGLFLNPGNANGRYFFPNSKSLELFDCNLRISGLLNVTENPPKSVEKIDSYQDYHRSE